MDLKRPATQEIIWNLGNSKWLSSQHYVVFPKVEGWGKHQWGSSSGKTSLMRGVTVLLQEMSLMGHVSKNVVKVKQQLFLIGQMFVQYSNVCTFQFTTHFPHKATFFMNTCLTPVVDFINIVHAPF